MISDLTGKEWTWHSFLNILKTMQNYDIMYVMYIIYVQECFLGSNCQRWPPFRSIGQISCMIIGRNNNKNNRNQKYETMDKKTIKNLLQKNLHTKLVIIS